MIEIVDGRTTLSVTLIKPPAQQVRPATQHDFLTWWREQAESRELPSPRFTGADRRLAQTLLARHGMKTLRRLGTHYWRRHAKRRESGLFEMQAFASTIPIIEAELKEQAP